jgi:hypothetical protein
MKHNPVQAVAHTAQPYYNKIMGASTAQGDQYQQANRALAESLFPLLLGMCEQSLCCKALFTASLFEPLTPGLLTMHVPAMRLGSLI